MSFEQSIETTRVDLQRKLDAAKSHTDRNKLGQFATPPNLALQILRKSGEYTENHPKIRFLDPAFGTGSFYSALLQAFPEERIESAAGFEIDPHYGEEAKRLWATSPLHLTINDFFSVVPPIRDSEKANLIVCNPPYVRHHHLTSDQKEHMSSLIARSIGMKINGLSGLYCYFLVHADNWLADDGVGCWLIPTEFMDVNYGLAVKEYLLKRVTLLSIHRFNPSESQFDDALVSSAVVWFRKSPPPNEYTVALTFGGTIETPNVQRQVSSSELLKSPKWTGLTNGHLVHREPGVRLADIFTVKRGLATGANEFFILTPEEAREHDLPSEFLIPILPGPRFLTEDIIRADARGNPKVAKPLFLLSCPLPAPEIKKNHPSLWKYLESGVRHKIDDRYLCNHRDPWYIQEVRPAAPFLCTYMGRHDSRKGKPFRFVLNLSKATAANVYLLLYPKPALSRLLKKHPGLAKKVWEALGNISSDSLIAEGRVYGGGLHKVEPRELGNAPAEDILKILPELRSELLQSKTPTLFEMG